MTVVNASTFLAVVLQGMDSISCESALLIRDKVEKSNSDIVIDLSEDSVIKAQRRYPYLFDINPDVTTVSRNKEFSSLPAAYFESEFYNLVGKRVMGEIIKENVRIYAIRQGM